MVTFTNEVVNAVSDGAVPVAFPALYMYHPDLSLPALGGTGCENCEGKGCVGCVNKNGSVTLPATAPVKDDGSSQDLSDLIDEDGKGKSNVKFKHMSDTLKHSVQFGMVSGLVCGYAAQQNGWYPFLCVYKGRRSIWYNYVFFLDAKETFESAFGRVAKTIDDVLDSENITVTYVSREEDDDGDRVTTEILPGNTPAELKIFSVQKFNILTLEHEDIDFIHKQKEKAEEKKEREKKRKLSLESLQARKKLRGSPDEGAKKP